MKLFSSLSLFVLYSLYFTSCKEVGPDINLGRSKSISDTTYVTPNVAAAELKNVLIEEFTGVRCPNCPQGHQIIKSLKTVHPDRIVSVSLHPINSLGNPYVFSVQNFQNQKAQILFDYFGQIGLEPAAAIDRELFNGESALLLDKSKWSSYTTAQLAVPTPVNLALSKTYDSTNRKLTIVAEMQYTTADTAASALTILLSESDMVTAQLNGATIDTFYTHNDVMREILTDTKGDAIKPNREPGRVVRRVYQTFLDNAWVADNMHVVAFVHEFLGSKKVYQAREIHIRD